MNDCNHNADVLSYKVIAMPLCISQKNYEKNIIIKMLREGHKLCITYLKFPFQKPSKQQQNSFVNSM